MNPALFFFTAAVLSSLTMADKPSLVSLFTYQANLSEPTTPVKYLTSSAWTTNSTEVPTINTTVTLLPTSVLPTTATSKVTSVSSSSPGISAATVTSSAQFCAPGRRVDILGDRFICSICMPGTFSNHINSTTCPKCPPGTYQNDTGAVTCRQCAPGYAQSDFGQSRCVPCSNGCSTNCTICKVCPPGFRSAGISGSRSCVPCGPGFQKPPTDVTCEPCPDGFYNTQLNASYCEQCPPSFYCPCQTCKYRCPTNAHCPPGSSRFLYCSPPFLSFDISTSQCTLSVFGMFVIGGSGFILLGIVIAVGCRIRKRHRSLQEAELNRSPRWPNLPAQRRDNVYQGL